MKKVIVLSAFLAMVCALAGRAMAESINSIETTGGTGTVRTLDNGAVVTAILSQPGTFNGKTYTSWSFMANDGTGSMVVYSTLAGLGYTPTVGDAITATGTYSPYHQIPEMGTVTSILANSSGNVVPPPTVTTIPAINQSTLPFSIAGYMLELDNVTISGQTGTFGITNSPAGAAITDGSGNSMTFYYWPTSYSTANVNLFGEAVPTGPVDMTGFVSVYGTTAEFSPMTITPVPEPATLVLLAAGGACALALRGLRRHAR
jgi:hypothetical protein